LEQYDYSNAMEWDGYSNTLEWDDHRVIHWNVIRYANKFECYGWNNALKSGMLRLDISVI
jgi:hypothetical protein